MKKYLRTLGLLRWGTVEPVILAALAVELPILFVSPHGTSKTEGAATIAEALLNVGENFTKYDTPIATIDDLVGYLSVQALQRDEIEYLRTKTCIWSASAVMFDEINRCSPLTLSKFMEAIRTRSIHGVKTPVRYVFGGCNPVRGYKATYMDPAQASRWVIVQVPHVDNLDEEAIYDILGGSLGGTPDDRLHFQALITQMRERILVPGPQDDMLRRLVARALKALSVQALASVEAQQHRPHSVQVRQGTYMYSLLRAYYAYLAIVEDTASVSDIQAIIMACIPEVHGVCDSAVDASTVATALRPVINEACATLTIPEIKTVQELLDHRVTRDKTGWAAHALYLVPRANEEESALLAKALVDMLRKAEIGDEAFNSIVDKMFKHYANCAVDSPLACRTPVGFDRKGMRVLLDEALGAKSHGVPKSVL